MNRPPCVSEHTFAWNRFFLPPTPTQTLTHLPLSTLATRIEAAMRHWRAHWACRLMLAHPGMRLVGDHPCRRVSPGCLGQFMTPTRGGCILATLESKGLSHLLHGFLLCSRIYLQLVIMVILSNHYLCGYNTAVIIVLQTVLLPLFFTSSFKTIYAENTVKTSTWVI